MLIVEDVADIHEDLERWVKEALPAVGAVEFATQTAEARWICLKRRPQLILLDEVLPGESAYEFCQEWGENEGIPLLLITGGAASGRAELPPGAMARCVKPSHSHWVRDVEALRSLTKTVPLDNRP